MSRQTSNKRGYSFHGKNSIQASDIPAMAHLRKDMLHALVLIAVRQRTYEDAAKILQVSVGTVKSRTYRARAELALLINSKTPATADDLKDWARETIVVNQGEDEDEVANGLAILREMAAGTWVNMPLYNQQVLRALAAKK